MGLGIGGGGRTKVAVFPFLVLFFVEIGRFLGYVVGEEAHVVPIFDRILW